MSSKVWIRKFFEKLTESDFNEDRMLATFYKAYKKEQEQERDTEGKLLDKGKIDLFDFYTQYLMRNKSFVKTQKKKILLNPTVEYEINEEISPEEQKQKEICILYDEIKKAIFEPTEEVDDRNPRLDRKQPDEPRPKKTVKKVVKKIVKKIVKVDKKTGKPIPNTPTVIPVVIPVVSQVSQVSPVTVTEQNGIKKIKLNKKHALEVLSNFIKASFITTGDNPEETITEEDINFKEQSTANILEETINEYNGHLPPAKKDEQFGRKNEMLEIWRHTEAKCLEFLEREKLAEILCKVYFLDGKQITLDNNNPLRTILVYNDDTKKEILPVETIMPRWTNKTYNGNVIVSNSHALTETMKRRHKQIPCVMVCSGSKWIAGGGSDQGIETNETPLYYTSSYHLCLNKLDKLYPLDNNQIIFTPQVFVLKDHTKPKYPLLSVEDSEKIVVLNNAPPYRPETDIKDADKYTMDPRLKLPSTKYKHPEKIIEQLKCIFNTVLFFGYDTIILDDRGIEYFWLPVHHTAQLMSLIINQYKSRFKEIVVAVENPEIYEVFKKYIC